MLSSIVIYHVIYCSLFKISASKSKEMRISLNDDVESVFMKTIILVEEQRLSAGKLDIV